MPEAVSPAWNSDLVANHNLLEWLPAANGQEWMMSRNLDGTSAPGNHLETRFDSAVDPVGDINRLDPTVPSQSMDRSKPALNRLRNSHPLTGCRIVDKRGVAGALTHRGPARDDDQVAVFEPARHPVQVVETRRNPDYSLTALHEDRDPLHRRAEQVVHPRPLPLVQGRAVDLPVVLAVEILGVQELQHLGDGERFEKDRPDDRDLGVEVVRWYPPCGEWKRGRHALRVSGPA